MTGYSATVEVTADGHSPADPRIDDPAVDQRLSELLDRLADMWGAVSGDGRGWSATVTVDADSIAAAREIATTAVLEQAAASGLPTGPMTRVEVVREDIRDAELERPTLPELVSGPEAAQILGVSRQRVHQLAHQHPDFPAPAYRLGVGSLWFRAGVERFAQDWDRRPGRSPKSTLDARPSSATLTARRPDRAASETNRRFTVTKGDVHTIWDKDDGVWKNRVEGGQRASSTASTKAEAQAKGRELAMKRGVEHHIHNQDGKVSARNSYGKDPKRRRG